MMLRYLLNLGWVLVLLALGPATGAFAALSEAERLQLAEMTDLPSVDLAVQFEYGAANVLPASVSDLDRLGRALSKVKSSETKRMVFMIVGFVDAKDDPKSRELAEQRAETVRRFLMSKYQFDADDLVTSTIAAPPERSGGIRVINISDKQGGEAAPK